MSNKPEPYDLLEAFGQSSKTEIHLVLAIRGFVMRLYNSDSTNSFDLQQLQLEPCHHTTRVASLTIDILVLHLASVRV